MEANVDDANDQLPEPPEKRVLGTLKDKIQVLDANWWKPMTDKEIEDFLVGRY
jgi:hypothetical protein